MTNSLEKPWAKSRATKYLDKHMTKLQGRKNRKEIAAEAGFPQPNILSMLRGGEAKIPIDRTISLAKAIEGDPGHFFKLVLEQQYSPDFVALIDEVYGGSMSANEREILAHIREVTAGSDPALTNALREKLTEALKDLAEV